MRIKLKGEYLTDDLAVVGQHIAVQLEALGVTSVGHVSLYLTPRDAKSRVLDVLSDGAPVETLEVEIGDLEKPAVQSAKITAHPASDGRGSPARSGQRRKFARRA